MIKFYDNKCFIYDKKNGQLVVSVDMDQNKIFPLTMPLERKFALNYKIGDLILWHLRFGHLNYKSL